MELKGSKTEKNLMPPMQKKKSTTLLPTNLNRQPTTKKNMQKSGSNCCMKAPFRIP